MLRQRHYPDDFALAGTEVELRKVQAKIREWYDAKARGIPRTARKRPGDIEKLGRRRRETPTGIVARMLNERGVQKGQQRGCRNIGNRFKLSCWKREARRSSSDTELCEYGQFRRNMHNKGDTHARKLEILKKVERYLVRVTEVTWEMRACDEDDKLNFDVYVESHWAKRPERKRQTEG